MGYHTVPDTSNHFYSLSCFFRIFYCAFYPRKKNGHKRFVTRRQINDANRSAKKSYPWTRVNHVTGEDES